MYISSSCCFFVSMAKPPAGAQTKEQTLNNCAVLLWFARKIKPRSARGRNFARFHRYICGGGEGEAMPRPIIIDTDPGIDDAVAILLALASPELDVLGLVAVAGNLPLAATARNALCIVELAGRLELPVYAGCPRPLGRPLIDVESAHGAGGLGDLVLPPPVAVLRPEHGILYLIDRLR